MLENTLQKLLQPLIISLGYELWGLQVIAHKKSNLLRIYIDKEAGITLDDCEIVSRQIGALLDVEDIVPYQYVLEVSSPGIPRPLFYNWQYKLYHGQMIRIKLAHAIDNVRNWQGIISKTTDKILTLTIEDNVDIDFLYSNISKAYLIGE